MRYLPLLAGLLVAQAALFEDSTFENDAARWQPSDKNAWKVEKADGKTVYHQFAQSKIKTPHRSPFNFSLIKELPVTDFVFEAKAKSTCKDYGHRDMCVFFGYQDPAHHYYVHMAKEADDRANQIFIVNGKDREKISTKSTKGTAWDDKWHDVKVVRKVADGTIEVYWDDMKTPIMTATDKTFAWGQVGVGSFDDTGMWTDIKLTGTKKSE